MRYEPHKMDPCSWLIDCGEYCECIAVYIDYLLIASKDPYDTADSLTRKHHSMLKGKGPMSYHLVLYFGRDRDGKLYFASRKNIEKMEEC